MNYCASWKEKLKHKKVESYMKKQVKKPQVTRKFLLNLARYIYNPKTKKYLNLCTGVLVNGPDPNNPKRLMHCGLGELYFKMTGKHPSKTLGESTVLTMALNRSSLAYAFDKMSNEALAVINKSDLSEESKIRLRLHFSRMVYDPDIDRFTSLLRSVADVNDSNATYKSRAVLVAGIYKAAAALLPK